VAAAVRYAEEGDPRNETWIATPSIPGEAITGFHGLALLLLVAEDRLDALPPSAWSKWMPMLLRHGNMEKDDLELGVRLLKRAYALIPEDVIASLERVIDSENERTGYFFHPPKSRPAGMIAWLKRCFKRRGIRR